MTRLPSTLQMTSSEVMAEEVQVELCLCSVPVLVCWCVGACWFVRAEEVQVEPTHQVEHISWTPRVVSAWFHLLHLKVQ